jgi:hypothetical protein
MEFGIWDLGFGILDFGFGNDKAEGRKQRA